MSERRGNESWIRPLLKRFDLEGKRDNRLARDASWRPIKESELVERIGRLVVEVNRAAGYRVLEMMDFLPTQKIVVRVAFERYGVKHSLEVAIRESEIVLMFSISRRVFFGWPRSLYVNSARNRFTLLWEQNIYPTEVLEENIQAWLCYLLSGLDKKFRLDQILQSAETPDTALHAEFGKVSA